MIDRRRFVGLAALAGPLALAATTTARADAGAKPFDEAAFAAAQGRGELILVEITAPWCPMCKAQKAIVADLRKQDRFKDLVVFEIDFDTQKDLMRRFGAQLQSTLIVFKGPTEAGRSVGEAQAEWIEAMFEDALATPPPA